MTYLDFSGLLILALTCNLVYIVFGRNDNMLYYRFLEKIDPAKHIFNKFNIGTQELLYIASTVYGIKEDIKNKESLFVGDSEDKILKNLFDSDFKKAKKLIEAVIAIMKKDGNLDTIRQEITSKKTEYDKKVEISKNINNLQYISIISFFYSFYILIIAPYAGKDPFAFNLNKSLCIMNLAMFVMSLMYLLIDMFQKMKMVASSLITIIIVNVPALYLLFKFFNISILISNIVAFLIIIVFRQIDDIRFRNLILCVAFLNLMIILAILHIDKDRLIECYIKFIGGIEKNYFITIFICFVGFILYLAQSIRCWWHSIRFSFHLRKNEDIKNAANLLSLFRKHEERIQPYQEKTLENFYSAFSQKS
jgi:hypothetical protein